MVPKSRTNRLQVAFTGWEPAQNAPHVIYANMEFNGNAMPKGGRRLLKFLSWSLPLSWTALRTLRYLKQHQEEFRNCLGWLLEGSRVDFGPVENDDDELRFREQWEREPAVRFLQEHGLDHGGVTLKPQLSDPMYPYEGLELDQKNARDPLDPICWYMLTLLMSWGSVFARRCRFSKCKKFFFPLTPRKLFCSDSCRAQHHAYEEFLKNPNKFHRERAKFMKKNRADRKALKEGREFARLRKSRD